MKKTICMFTALLLSTFTYASIYVVTNTADAGPGSLREAIMLSNANPGPDEIHFSIPGSGGHVIALSTGLPLVEAFTTIDGYTQLGALTATATVPAVLKIILNGSSMAIPYSSAGIWVAGNCTVKGLVIQDFENGFSLAGDNNVIQGNYVGTTVDGSTAYGNLMDGIFFTGINNLIGGPSPADRNLVSGNTGPGISGFPDADLNTIMGNYIGTDATGSYAIPNAYDGIGLGGDHNTISNNLISGDGGNNGILIQAWTLEAPFPDGNVVTGNIIGMDANLSAPLPNGQGISVNQAINTVITGNTIAGNNFHGVLVDGDDATGNLISQNSIYNNSELGINLDQSGAWITPNDPGDFDSGPNLLQNYPVLTSAKVTPNQNTLIVKGEIDTQDPTQVTIEFYANSTGDLLGHGEGEIYLGTTSTVGANGKFNINLPGVAVGTVISALAIDGSNNTSEFAANIEAVPINGGHALVAPGTTGVVLTEVFPNPFKHAATISFELKERGPVHLAICDASGREIAVLIDEDREAGFHKVTFRPTNFPAGQYYFRIQGNDFSDSGKLTLQK